MNDDDVLDVIEEDIVTEDSRGNLKMLAKEFNLAYEEKLIENRISGLELWDRLTVTMPVVVVKSKMGPSRSVYPGSPPRWLRHKINQGRSLQLTGARVGRKGTLIFQARSIGPDSITTNALYQGSEFEATEAFYLFGKDQFNTCFSLIMGMTLDEALSGAADSFKSDPVARKEAQRILSQYEDPDDPEWGSWS